MKLKTAGWVKGAARVPYCWCTDQGRGRVGRQKRGLRGLECEAGAELCPLEGEDFTREPRVKVDCSPTKPGLPPATM